MFSIIITIIKLIMIVIVVCIVIRDWKREKIDE